MYIIDVCVVLKFVLKGRKIDVVYVDLTDISVIRPNVAYILIFFCTYRIEHVFIFLKFDSYIRQACFNRHQMFFYVLWNTLL